MMYLYFSAMINTLFHNVPPEEHRLSEIISQNLKILN